MNRQALLHVTKGFRWRDIVHAGQPFERVFGFSLVNGMPDVFDLMAFRAQSDQPCQSLNTTMVIVMPYFVTLYRVWSPGPAAGVAMIIGRAKSDRLEPIPRLWCDVGSHVAIPASLWDKFDS